MNEKKGFFGGLFGKKKNSDCCNMEIIEETKCGCNGGCCEETNTEKSNIAEALNSDGKIVIKVVGTGCAKCNKLTENVQQAADELGIDNQIIKITDMMEIAATGIMQTPGLIINNKIVAYGKVPGVNELKEILKKQL
jgi:small redox-active disulfide protein 2